MADCIKNILGFDDYLNVFKVFESFPFFERWTTEEIQSEYDTNLSLGCIFGFYRDEKCVGFISFREQQPNEHPIHYSHQSKVLYISDLAVLPDYRKKGIGSKLLDSALEYAIAKKYDYAYIRINENNPMGIGLCENFGFVKEHKYCQIVSRPHTKNYKEAEEFRIFMSKKL